MAFQNEFDISVNITPRTGKGLFNEGRFVVPSCVRKDWQDSETDGKYRFHVSAALREKYQGTVLEPVLNQMDDAGICSTVKIQMNQGKSGLFYQDGKLEERSGNYNCYLSPMLLEQFKLLFFLSFVFCSQGRDLPKDPERFTLRFNVSEKTVLLTERNLKIDLPDDPFFEYARTAARYTSCRTAFHLKEDGGGQEEWEDGQVKNIYQDIKGWMPVSELDWIDGGRDGTGRKADDIPDVIYMLYDENAGTFYVGKADRLAVRLRQHQENRDGKDPIPDFTHFRFSTISPEYADWIYLIENTAIHDCAWLLDMEKFGRASLQKLMETGALQGDFSKITMVNSVKQQTRSRNKQE